MDGFRLFRPPPRLLLSFSADVRLQKGRRILSGRKAAKPGAGRAELPPAMHGRPCGGRRSGMGMEWAAAGRIGRRAAGPGVGVCRVRGWIGEASRKQSWSGGSVAMAGPGRRGRMPSPGRLLGAQRWVQRRAFRPREALGAGEERGRAKRRGTKRGRDSPPSRALSPPLALRRVHDELVCLWIMERRR